MNIQNPNELRQLLLEWHYGLLDEEDANTLQALVKDDADVAAAWSETLRTAEKLGAACRADDPSPVPTIASPTKAKVAPVGKPTRSVWRTPSILALVAACVGWFVITLDYRGGLPPQPKPAISIKATLLTSGDVRDDDRAGRAQEFRITTAKLANDRRDGQLPAIATKLSYSVLAKGTVLFLSLIHI